MRPWTRGEARGGGVGVGRRSILARGTSRTTRKSLRHKVSELLEVGLVDLIGALVDVSRRGSGLRGGHDRVWGTRHGTDQRPRGASNTRVVRKKWKKGSTPSTYLLRRGWGRGPAPRVSRAPLARRWAGAADDLCGEGVWGKGRLANTTIEKPVRRPPVDGTIYSIASCAGPAPFSQGTFRRNRRGRICHRGNRRVRGPRRARTWR